MALVHHGGEALPRRMTDERFADLYARTYAPLVGYCRRFQGADPEDLAQETLMRAWLSWDPALPEPPSWAFLATIARRAAIDDHRSDERRRARMRRVARKEAEPSAEELFEEGDDRRRAVRAMQALRPEQRRIIELRDVGGLSYNDIAEAEDVSVESVRACLKRSRAALRVAFDRLGGRVMAVLAFPFARRSSPSTRAQGAQALSGHLGELALAVVATATLAAAVGPDRPASGRPDTGLAAAPAPEHAASRPVSGPNAAEPLVTGASSAQVLVGTPAPSRSPVAVAAFQRGAADTGLLGGGAEQADQATFTSITPSPAYAADGTVFAVGLAGGGCLARCTVLFRSDDRGARWTRLAASGFEGDRVLLPPAFPRDPRIYASGAGGLQVSSDGGSSFATLAAIPGEASLSPRFDDGDARIALGGLGGWEYDAATGVLRPLGIAPRALSGDLTLAFSAGDSDPPTLYVGGTVPGADDPAAGAVQRCSAGSCSAPVLLGQRGAPRLLTTATATGGSVVVAWGGQAMSTSLDGGRTFGASHLTSTGSIVAVSAVGGSIYALVVEPMGERTASTISSSADGGRTWAPLRSSWPGALGALVALPEHVLVAAPQGAAAGGVRCSHDGGESWEKAC